MVLHDGPGLMLQKILRHRQRNFFITFLDNKEVPPLVAEISWTTALSKMSEPAE